ncbi:MAG: hypothetical protein ACRD3D_01005 [Terriglobia bacterium]
MTDQAFQEHVIDSLARLETDMRALVGNGQPGRVDKIEAEISSLQESRARGRGAIAAIGACAAALATAATLLTDYLIRHVHP